MNCYRDLAAKMNIDGNSTNELSLLNCFLTELGEMEAANPTANTYSTPAREVLHRLNDGSVGYRRLAFLLNDFTERESRQ